MPLNIASDTTSYDTGSAGPLRELEKKMPLTWGILNQHHDEYDDRDDEHSGVYGNIKW